MATITITAAVAGQTYSAGADIADTDAARILAAFQAPLARKRATWADFLKAMLADVVMRVGLQVQSHEQVPPPAPPIVVIK